MNRTIYIMYFNELINLFPTINDALNLKKYKHLKKRFENSINPSHIKLQKEFYYKYLKLVEAIPNKTIFDQVLLYDIKTAISSLKFNYHLLPLDHENNPVAWFCEMANGSSIYDFKTQQDYHDFINKTQEFILFLENCLINMKIGIQKKVILPKILTQKLLKQLKDIIKTKPYINKKVPKTLKIDFNKKIEDLLLPIIKKIVVFIIKEYLPNSRKSYGVSSLPNGEAMYRNIVKNYTSLNNITIKSIHNYGLQEVNRIYQEMHNVKDKMNFKGTIDQFNKYFKSAQYLKFKNEADVITSYKKMQTHIDKTILSKKFTNKIPQNAIITKVPKYNEKYAPSAYYMPPNLDLTRQGKFYINLKKINDLSKAEIESLTLHEALPGHHYQLTDMMLQKLPMFIKISDQTAYIEGWGLYCENLGEYKTPESYYGKLNMEMMRAIRLVVDTGLHYYQWSPQKCINFFKKYSFYSQDEIETEVYRYMAYPGQALAYKIGEKTFLDLKNKFKGTEKKFHDQCLKYGPIPLDILVKSFN